MKTALLIALQLAASGSDAYFTHRAINPRYHEHNPIARPFVKTTAWQVSYFSAGAAIKITIPILLRKRHHPKLADTLAIAGIADNAVAAAYSATHP